MYEKTTRAYKAPELRTPRNRRNIMTNEDIIDELEGLVNDVVSRMPKIAAYLMMLKENLPPEKNE